MPASSTTENRQRCPRRAPALALLALCAILLCPGLAAEDMGIRQWSNDSKIFLEQVLKPVGKHFEGRDCTVSFADYFGPLFIQLRAIKTTVAAKSYLLFRDIITVSAEELAPFEAVLQCEMLNRWEFLNLHIRSKIELIGNVFLILE